MMQLLLLVVIGASYLFEVFLESLNRSTWKENPPEMVRPLYSQEAYRKARNYNLEKFGPGNLEQSLVTILLILMIGYDGFLLIRELSLTLIDWEIASGILFFGVLSLGGALLSFPFDIYHTFVIEEKYGFNRSDWKTFLFDRIRGGLVGSVLGGLVLFVILFSNQVAGFHGWWISWIVVSLLSVLLSMMYTTWIVPLFNTLRPLQEGPLKDQVTEYLKSVSFPLEHVRVMDGSKRSTRANAFFSGFGSRKSVVLYDTMIEAYKPEEIVSVLAHEVGHYKKKHIISGMAFSILQTGVMLFLMFGLMNEPMFSSALGANGNDPVLGLLVFFILYSPVSMGLSVLSGIVSRKNEFEADRFAKETASKEHLIGALKKLSVDHLSNLHPHPAYVFVHYSHPPLIQRMKALLDP